MTDNKNDILLIGDIGTAFTDADTIGAGCQIRKNILDGIEAAAKGDFTIIAVVIRGLAADLPAAMKALRRTCDCRDILLAQMWEEP